MPDISPLKVEIERRVNADFRQLQSQIDNAIETVKSGGLEEIRSKYSVLEKLTSSRHAVNLMIAATILQLGDTMECRGIVRKQKKFFDKLHKILLDYFERCIGDVLDRDGLATFRRDEKSVKRMIAALSNTRSKVMNLSREFEAVYQDFCQRVY